MRLDFLRHCFWGVIIDVVPMMNVWEALVYDLVAGNASFPEETQAYLPNNLLEAVRCGAYPVKEAEQNDLAPHVESIRDQSNRA